MDLINEWTVGEKDEGFSFDKELGKEKGRIVTWEL